jgi:hypothetical protein
MEENLFARRRVIMELAIFLGAGLAMMLMTLSLQKYIYNRAYVRRNYKNQANAKAGQKETLNTQG